MLGISRERQLIPGRIEPLPRPGCSLHKYKNKIKKKISSSILSSRARETPFAVAPMTGS